MEYQSFNSYINQLTVISVNILYVMTSLSVALKLCSVSLSWPVSRYLGRFVLVCLANLAAKDWNFYITLYRVGVLAQSERHLTRTHKGGSSISSHGMEELGRSSYKPLPHPTQVQWVLGNRR